MAAEFGWQELQAFKRLLILIYISQAIPYNFDQKTNPKLLLETRFFRSHFGSLDARHLARTKTEGRGWSDTGTCNGTSNGP
jgi:hypothetical protein